MSCDAIITHETKFSQKASFVVLTLWVCASQKTSSYWHMQNRVYA